MFEFQKYIASINDFPKEGIVFRDITPLMANGEAFQKATEALVAFAKKQQATVVVGPEARGFIFGCPVAVALGIGFIPVRKPGKLPRATESVSYDLEYGSNELHIHADAIKPGDRVLIVDDLLATGGTVAATVELVKKLGGEVVGCAFLIELTELQGRQRLAEQEVLALLSY